MTVWRSLCRFIFPLINHYYFRQLNSALAFDRDARDEAHAVVDAAVSGDAPASDPWRVYQAADFRFWTAFVELVRRGLR